MMDKFAIFDYAEKGALADYEKACMMYKLFRDEKSKAAMDDAFATAHEIRRLHVAEIEKMKAAEELRQAQQQEEAKQAQQAQQPPTPVEPLDYTVNVEFTSGRKMRFHHDDKDLARHMYEFTKEQAKGAFHGDILRASLVQHNADKSETVLSSMDVG